MKITPNNPLLKTYRSLKRVQKWACECIRKDSVAVESITEEIAESEQPGVTLDLCPIMRFVLIWAPLLAAVALVATAAALGLAWAIIQWFLLPFSEFIAILLKIATTIGCIVLIVVGFVALFFAADGSMRLARKAFPKKPEQPKTEDEIQAETAARAAAPPEKKFVPVITAWAKATHERFCIRMEVVPEMELAA